jgi:signal transduction histidine kinase
MNLARSEDVRRHMLADIAHELRNPLAILRAKVEAMLLPPSIWRDCCTMWKAMHKPSSREMKRSFDWRYCHTFLWCAPIGGGCFRFCGTSSQTPSVTQQLGTLLQYGSRRTPRRC